jgi:hypothetical protein
LAQAASAASGKDGPDFLHRLLATPARSAFRLETRATYALSYERADFERFLAGSPVPPPEAGWWRPWLEQISKLASEGKRISRVRVLAEPPSDYQRWMLWGNPWHAKAGEQICYLPRSRAERIGLPLVHDWWLLDDERLIDMRFTDAGEIAGKSLITDPGTVASYFEIMLIPGLLQTPDYARYRALEVVRLQDVRVHHLRGCAGHCADGWLSDRRRPDHRGELHIRRHAEGRGVGQVR